MTGRTVGILAGYDGSTGSEHALSWAAREARSRGIALTVCHAWAPGFTALPGQAAVAGLARHGGERVIADGLRQARDLMGPGEVRPLLISGQATAVLCDHSHDADMLVVGSRGRGGVGGMLLGSVSWQVAAHARCPVVVVRGHWRPVVAMPPVPSWLAPTDPRHRTLRWASDSRRPRSEVRRSWRCALLPMRREAWAAFLSCRRTSSRRSPGTRRSIRR